MIDKTHSAVKPDADDVVPSTFTHHSQEHQCIVRSFDESPGVLKLLFSIQSLQKTLQLPPSNAEVLFLIVQLHTTMIRLQLIDFSAQLYLAKC